MAKESAARSISRNRKPPVHIVYEQYKDGATKKVELPFVMGVMGDLSGDPSEPAAPLAERKFLDFSVENFDDRMKAIHPRVAVAVPNRITGEGNLAVDLTFESLGDFSPTAIAKKIPALSKLLNVRSQLADLLTYMDGKQAAEEFVLNLLDDPELLRKLLEHRTPEPSSE
jgi:type VI secretion system protein ImpB